ncbi:MAG: DUF370 domain-containing protein [Clostridia bacterium]|nr:DUF370 domain-containing protein [Clostridia bacterium]
MYLHAGNHKNIRLRDIVGIFDTDNATLCEASRKFLSEAQKQGLVSAAKEEIPKSFILYREQGRVKVCFSQLSSAALMGRMKQ